jgi:hypothetical protein
MSGLGGVLIGFGLMQALLHVRSCRETYWAPEDGPILAGLLTLAGIGALMWWLS